MRSVNLQDPGVKQDWIKCQFFLESQDFKIHQAYQELEELKRHLEKENRRIAALEKEYIQASSAHAKAHLTLNEAVAIKLLQCPAN